MYQWLALLNGILLSIMVSINGNLSEDYSAFAAAVIIHAVGSVFALVLCMLQKEKKALWTHQPKWIYLGGAIGVFTTVFQNLAFGRISITSVIALGLLGQTVTSLVIDSLGLFGMEKRQFQLNTVFGLAVSIIGIFMMMDRTVTTAAFAVSISFGSGVSMVLSRTVNARLSEKTGALRGSLVNHLVGLPITVAVAMVVAGGPKFLGPLPHTFRPWIYLGGMLGVIVVMTLNITVPKVPAFRLTLLLFVGQVFTGITLDILAGNRYSSASFWGGIVIAAGIVINMITEHINVGRLQSC